MSNMQTALVLLGNLALRILRRVKRRMVEDFWRLMLEWVVDAEAMRRELGSGEAKKEWVLEHLGKWLDAEGLRWFQRQIVLAAAGQFLDSLIQTINDELGEDWGQHVDSLRDDVATWAPWLA